MHDADSFSVAMIGRIQRNPLAEQYGLEAADFEREFIAGGERFRITGIDPRRPKYPISVERIPDRRGFKFTADNVAMLLKAQAKP